MWARDVPHRGIRKQVTSPRKFPLRAVHHQLTNFNPATYMGRHWDPRVHMKIKSGKSSKRPKRTHTDRGQSGEMNIRNSTPTSHTEDPESFVPANTAMGRCVYPVGLVIEPLTVAKVNLALGSLPRIPWNCFDFLKQVGCPSTTTHPLTIQTDERCNTYRALGKCIVPWPNDHRIFQVGSECRWNQRSYWGEEVGQFLWETSLWLTKMELILEPKQ